ncbi:hypothetical protein KI387_017156, partial [Taxus chinensis]
CVLCLEEGPSYIFLYIKQSLHLFRHPSSKLGCAVFPQGILFSCQMLRNPGEPRIATNHRRNHFGSVR